MKIAILTNMMDFNPGYSLTGIVYDQTIMLHRYGHDVHLFTNVQFNPSGLDFSHVTVHNKIPFAHLKDYNTKNDLTGEHDETVQETTKMLVNELADFDIVFTHDFIFVGWFLPYGLACILAAKQLRCKWMHWIHSVPSVMRDWWNIKEWGEGHKLVFPNRTDQIRVAEQYRGEVSDVRVIPHIKDLRTWADFGEESKRLIDMMPAVMSSHIMQVLPAGSDRLSAKGVEQVISIFGHIKKFGFKVCLLIANQWATGRQRKECIEPYETLAKNMGLEPGVDFAFTSDLHKDWANGLNKRMLRELFMCSNLFVFPTREESFGLVVPEASLTSGCLMVLNKSLEQQVEISGFNSLYFDFGSYTRNHVIKDYDRYFRDVAAIILGRMKQNESVQTKTWFKNSNNYDFLYEKYYNPIMMELKCIS